MAMNLLETGTAALVGLASGYATNHQDLTKPLLGDATKPDALGTVYADKAVELAALVGGAAMQYFAPFTYPSVADGLVAGGAALLGRRIGVTTFKATASGYSGGHGYAGGMNAGGAYGMPSYSGGMGARGQIGSISGVSKFHV